jgi:hypothetical protein
MRVGLLGTGAELPQAEGFRDAKCLVNRRLQLLAILRQNSLTWHVVSQMRDNLVAALPSGTLWNADLEAIDADDCC